MPEPSKSGSEQRASTALLIAIIGAAAALGGNALVAWMNGVKERELEESRHAQAMRSQEAKSQQERILEIIRTGNVEKAAENLKFAVDVGLVADPKIRAGIEKYLSERKPGAGPALPPGSWSTTHPTYSTGTTYEYNYNDGYIGSPRGKAPQSR